MHDEELHNVKAIINIKDYVAVCHKSVPPATKNNHTLCKYIQTNLEFILATTRKMFVYNRERNIIKCRLPLGRWHTCHTCHTQNIFICLDVALILPIAFYQALAPESFSTSTNSQYGTTVDCTVVDFCNIYSLYSGMYVIEAAELRKAMHAIPAARTSLHKYTNENYTRKHIYIDCCCCCCCSKNNIFLYFFRYSVNGRTNN